MTETAKPGYTTSAGCSIDDGGMQQRTATSGGGRSTTTRTPEGDTAVTTSVRWWSDMPYTTTCTFTNVYHRPPTGTVTLAKVLQPAGAGQFNLTLDGANTTVAGSAGDVTFGDGDQSDATVVPAGDHVVGERAATPGQALSDYTASLACVNRAAQSAAVPVQAGGTIAVHDGDDVLCTFTNTKLPGIGRRARPAEHRRRRPARAAAGRPRATRRTSSGRRPAWRARVRPSGCAVTGSRASRSRSNGRHLRTVRTRDANGVYALVVRTRTLPRGATIVVARVTFRGSTRQRTLRLRLSRCGARSVRPTFTG